MECYAEYKDSGVEWIGDIPSHWESLQLKYLLQEKKHVSNSLLSCGSISFGEVVEKDDESIPEERKLTYQEVLRGEFLVNPLNLNYDLKSLRIALSGLNVVVSPGYLVLQLDESQDKHFFEFMLRHFDTEHMKSLGAGVRQTISFTHLKNELLICPPKNEQIEIGRFLDERTGWIDEAVKKTEKKIALLKEQRASLINEVVTKGLDPNVEMKDSGVEWIGDIPSHWALRRGSTIGDYSKGAGITKGEVVEEGFPCVRYGELYTQFNHALHEPVSFIESPGQVLASRGAIFITASGETVEEIGKCVVYLGDGEISVGGDIIVLDAAQDYDSEYLSYLINSEGVRCQRAAAGRGGIIVHIYSKNFRQMAFVHPPVEEQERIVAFLDERTGMMDEVIAKEEERMLLLKEYRKSLISEVVTGERKVVDEPVGLN